MRVADADRERVAARLREALEEGRLTLHELDERLQAAYLARTYADLERLVADLPAAADLQPRPTPPPPPPPSRHEANPKLHPALSYSWRLWFVGTLVSLVLWFVISVATGSLAYFFPIWVSGPWAVVNVALTIIFPPRHRS